jgi:hypothetical protein
MGWVKFFSSLPMGAFAHSSYFIFCSLGLAHEGYGLHRNGPSSVEELNVVSVHNDRSLPIALLEEGKCRTSKGRSLQLGLVHRAIRR